MRSLVTIAVSLSLVASVLAQEAPAPNPPTVVAPAAPRSAVASKPMAPLPASVWSIGSPTNDEQLYLELINRARANPAAEGTRLRNTTDTNVLSAYTFFGVDKVMMESEFALIAAAPPLAFHTQLMDAARDHCQYLFTNALQSHTGSGGSTLGVRLTAAGYAFTSAGECVYSYADSVFYGHAGFEVDWGPGGTGGMQAGRGHRVILHSANFREIGIGVINGSNTVGPNSVGPQVVVQDLAARSGSTPLITGVVFTDGDADSFYDQGEGVGNIIVTIVGGSFFAVTSSSGGYAVPVPGNGTFTVTFTAADGFTVISTQMITVAGLANAKADVTNAPAGSGAVPEINVTRSAITVADGSTDVVAGVTVGVPTAVSYLVANSGTAPLTVGTVTIGSLVNCTAVVSTAPSALVAALGSTTLGVTVTPSATTWSCTVSVVTNDTDENPMNWTMSNAAAPGGGGGGGPGGSSSGGGGGGCGAGGGSAATVGFGLLLALSLSRRRPFIRW